MTTSSPPLSPTERTQIHRHRERARTDRQELYDVLDVGMVCHLGVIIDGYPVVMPTGYGRLGDTLYLHGSSANRSMRAAAGGGVCVAVTHLDGLVLARSVFNHSMNYRSAVIFGTAWEIEQRPDKLAALRVVVEHLAPGQWDAVRQPTRKELAATMVLALPLDEASVKIRSGGPRDGDGPDAELGLWAGVLPIRQVVDEPIPAPDLPDGIDFPEHLRHLAHGRAGYPQEALRWPA